MLSGEYNYGCYMMVASCVSMCKVLCFGLLTGSLMQINQCHRVSNVKKCLFEIPLLMPLRFDTKLDFGQLVNLFVSLF